MCAHEWIPGAGGEVCGLCGIPRPLITGLDFCFMRWSRVERWIVLGGFVGLGLFVAWVLFFVV